MHSLQPKTLDFGRWEEWVLYAVAISLSCLIIMQTFTGTKTSVQHAAIGNFFENFVINFNVAAQSSIFNLCVVLILVWLPYLLLRRERYAVMAFVISGLIIASLFHYFQNAPAQVYFRIVDLILPSAIALSLGVWQTSFKKKWRNLE